MKRKISVLTLVTFLTFNVFGQGCFEVDLKVNEVESETQYLKFAVFYENDSIKKICWWNKGRFRAQIYNGKKYVNTQIIKEPPSEYNSGETTYRGHILRENFFIDKKNIEFYTPCN